MRLIFLYGPPASGKLTVGRLVAERTALPLFHNHLVVDAVAAVFPFGSEAFVRLRESFWMQVISSAAQEGRSLIFTFAPEPTVEPAFPERVAQAVRNAGGDVIFVALEVGEAEQERRLVAAERAAFGKLRSLDLLRELQPGLAMSMASMPRATLRIDTDITSPSAAAVLIAAAYETTTAG
ncbi:MAG: shikimate kinase [Pseudomonadota bacterium]